MTDNVCCDCKHFRMWNPQKCYCNVKKTVVDPLSSCEKFIVRKGFEGVDA